ncbi:MAG: hypothetical protein JNM78_10935 [Cyclobacteriaceae bacterium]|nr:hypothetical protein [Cyclobacteriaceae bacterium]
MNFRFNTIQQLGPYKVNWYRLHEEDGEAEGVCLTKDELDRLTDFVINNKTNFSDSNYFQCNEAEMPGCSIYDLLPSKSRTPINLILRKVPKLAKRGGEIHPCMDIELLKQNGVLGHTYNLDFDLIGEVISD